MTTRWPRALYSALLAYIAGFAAFLILFGNPVSERLIFTSSYGQSDKLIQVWKSVEPIPPVTPFWDRLTSIGPRAIPVLVLLYVWTLGLTWIYDRVSDSIPGDGWEKGVPFGFGLWLAAFVLFETFTPLNLFGEPLYLIAYELLLMLLIAISIGTTIAATKAKEV